MSDRMYVSGIMRLIIGGVLQVAAFIVWFICGLCGLLLNLAIVNKVAGFWGCVVGFMLLPVMFVVAPWYAVVEWEVRLPVAVTYGGGVAALILYGIGTVIIGNPGDEA